MEQVRLLLAHLPGGRLICPSLKTIMGEDGRHLKPLSSQRVCIDVKLRHGEFIAVVNGELVNDYERVLGPGEMSSPARPMQRRPTGVADGPAASRNPDLRSHHLWNLRLSQRGRRRSLLRR